MAVSFAVLAALRTPRTVAELAAALALPPAYVRHELERLERRGYVRRLACGGDAGPTGTNACGWCSLRAACEAAAGERWFRADAPPRHAA